MEQHERDLRAGKRFATFVSGYQGIPLAALDKLLAGFPSYHPSTTFGWFQV